MAGAKGRSGRPPKPTALHILDGTYRRDRHKIGRKGEPSASATGAPPPPPPGLEPEVLAAWNELAGRIGHKVFTDEDAFAFEAMAQMWAMWRAAGAKMRKEGISNVSETKDGRTVESMASHTRVWLDLNTKLLQYFARFGLTPADRARVKEVEGGDSGKQEDPDDEFAIRRA